MSDMSQAAFRTLPSTWQVWVTENLTRGCDPKDMAVVMQREGRFDPALAHAAITEAADGNRSAQGAEFKMPRIDTSKNKISCGDRQIDILFKLSEPYVVLLGNVLETSECDELVAYCQPRLCRSPVVGQIDGSAESHMSRTSQGAFLRRGETKLIERIDQRLSTLANWPTENGEGLQLQQYATTNEYQPHFDWFNPSSHGERAHLRFGGQRVATFVLYLDEVESGGGTSFSALGLEVAPKKGNALFFRNVDSRGEPDSKTLHAGTPVVRGTKTIANKWFRERANQTD